MSQSIHCVNCFHLVTSSTDEKPLKEAGCPSNGYSTFIVHLSLRSAPFVHSAGTRARQGLRLSRVERCGPVSRLILSTDGLVNQSIGNENPGELTRKTFNYNARRTQAAFPSLHSPFRPMPVVLHSLGQAGATTVVQYDAVRIWRWLILPPQLTEEGKRWQLVCQSI